MIEPIDYGKKLKQSYEYSEKLENYYKYKIDLLEKKISTTENQVELLKEDIECPHMWLDDQGIPRTETEGEYRGDSFSIIGRVQMLLKA